MAWSYAATFFWVGSGLILFPFILNRMPAETVGIWNIFQTITVMVAILDFGFQPSFARNLSYVFSGVRSLRKEGVAVVSNEATPCSDATIAVDYGLLKGTLVAMQRLFRIISLAAFALLATAGTAYFLYILGKYSGDRNDAIIAWVLLIVLNCYDLYTLYYDALLKGKGYVRRSQQIMILSQSVYVALAIGLIYAGLGLSAIVGSRLVAIILRRVLSHRIFFTRPMREALAGVQANDPKEIMQAIYPNAIKIGLTQLGSLAVNKSAMLIGAAFLSLEEVAGYGITLQLLEILCNCSTVPYRSFSPKLAQCRAENDLRGLRRYYLICEAVLLLIWIGGGSIAVLWGDDVLRLIKRTAMRPDKPTGSLCSPEHYAAARKIGGEGIVLLKNDGLLPVSEEVKNILVVGENAIKSMTVGGGSSSLKVQHETYPLDGITARAEKAGAEVKWVRGYVGSTDNSYNGVKSGQDLSESRSAAELIAEAVEEAAKADLVLFIGGLNKSRHQDCEGTDRYSLDLPYGQDAVIEALVEANPRTAVIIISGNPVAMPWVAEVPAIVEAWHGGSEAGNALSDVLWGDVNPSGHLPFTFPVALTDSPAHQEGMTFPNDGKTVYEEGILVGYRWFDTKGIEPLFPFGHGLSYTTFEIGKAKASAGALRTGGSLQISVPVKNTGDRTGAEVVQLYISDDEASVLRPEKELKGFEKVYLEPGETKTVTFSVKEEDLRWFDADKHEWVNEPGSYTARIGSSAGTIATTVSFNLK